MIFSAKIPSQKDKGIGSVDVQRSGKNLWTKYWNTHFWEEVEEEALPKKKCAFALRNANERSHEIFKSIILVFLVLLLLLLVHIQYFIQFVTLGLSEINYFLYLGSVTFHFIPACVWVSVCTKFKGNKRLVM